MIIRKPADIPYSQVTPKQVYLNRRRFLAAGSAALGTLAAPFAGLATKLDTRKSQFSTTEKLTSLQDITHYNNYYEFGTGKEEPAELSKKWRPASDWTISIEGEVAKPKTLSLDNVMKLAPLEERIYRHRCVERWSIVVPWIGFSLSELLKQVEPT